MTNLLDNLIKTAIAEHKILEFNYDSCHRIVEPHVYGITSRKYELLVYQIGGGSSSGGIPNWRRMEIRKISNMTINDQHFKGPRPYPSGKHSSFDTKLAVVK